MSKCADTSCLPPASRPGLREAGTDEAGRGCLAGPVFAAAVILPPDFAHPGINDAKKLSHTRRMEMAAIIRERALAWAVARVDAGEIDRINILQASILAMHRALDALDIEPEAVAVDGNRFRPWRQVPWQTFVKGDGRLANIAAASILAKTERDLFMQQAALEYPQYHWEENKGYPTISHRAAIAQHGPSPLHRMSFRLLAPQQLSLFQQ